MKAKIKIEEKFLIGVESMIQKLLDKEFEKSNSNFDAFTKHRIKDLVNRLINQWINHFWFFV